MKIKEMSNCERPRERLLELGPEALSNNELIAVLLRSGTSGINVLDLSRQLLAEAGGSLTTLSQMDRATLSCIDGIKDGKAAVIMAAFELGRRFFDEQVCQNKPIRDALDVFEIMHSQLRALDHEECWVLYLNRNHRLITRKKIGHGCSFSVCFDPKDIVSKAIKLKASSIVLIHNHPGGSPSPSSDDIELTAILKHSCDACDIRLLDHVIMCNDSYYSFKEEKIFGVSKNIDTFAVPD